MDCYYLYPRAPYTAMLSAFFSADVIPEMDYHEGVRAVKP
jgi:hypothetical protein